MKTLALLFIFLVTGIVSSQAVKKVELKLEGFTRQPESISMYWLRAEERIPLVYEGGMLVLDGNITGKDDVTIVLINRNEKLSFHINPKQMYYLEITTERKLRNLFRKRYIINQGFDNVEVVTSSQ